MVGELNDYLNTVVPGTEPRAVLSSQANSEGARPDTDKVSVTLINLEPESTVRNLLPDRQSGGEFARVNPALKLNLNVLFAANFKEYDEALKFLSSTLAFFQGHSVFTSQTSPRLHRSIDRLVVELQASTYQDWSHLWGMLGSKHMPGVVYKVKMISIQDGISLGNTPAVSGLGVNR